ncbi:MAG: hypothetical protein JWM95_1983 [Gemmatimonadetes bacterium]|nr:hypothetical protein [Gemmatimonadota bacterium]
MAEWFRELDALIGGLDESIRSAGKRVRSVLRDDDPIEILCYRGYGNSSAAIIHGRVLEQRGISPSGDHDSTLRNLINTWRRAEADPVELAEVAVTCAGGSLMVRGDNEGFFTGRLELGPPIDPNAEWITYAADLLSPVSVRGTVSGSGDVLIPPTSATFGVISDIDDTVIQSRVSSFLLAARTVMLGNARTRLPFPGVAAFYQALRAGATGSEKNPIFYVSSSPWNIHDVITEFMDLQKIPRGPVLLRDWDISLGALAATRHLDHKGAAIRSIMAMYPLLPFILIGDTSQHDPEIYRQIVGEFPGRIRAIYIRDVTRNEERAASVSRLADEIRTSHSTLVLAEDTLGAAKHAAEQGWIRADALGDVHQEKRADEGATGEKVATPEGGAPSSGNAPTVINP